MTASVYVKESVAMDKNILFLIAVIRNKICFFFLSKYLSGSEKNSRQVYKYLATTLAKSQKSTIL